MELRAITKGSKSLGLFHCLVMVELGGWWLVLGCGICSGPTEVDEEMSFLWAYLLESDHVDRCF